MRHALSILMLLACTLGARSATGQALATERRPEFITMTTATSSAVVVGTIMLTVVNVRRDPSAMHHYLKQNEPAVRAALTVGGGAIVRDIAAFFDIAPRHHRQFAALLRRHREALNQAAFGDSAARTFVSIVNAAIAHDQEFRTR